MKIDRSKLKRTNSELPEPCRVLIGNILATKEDESLYEILRDVQSWEYGKSELYHWVDVLDLFDVIMERSCKHMHDSKWSLACDEPQNIGLKQLMLQVVRFTSLLIEHSFQRYSYESMDHLLTLLSSSDMCVVLEVLNVLYVFSKRSNFISRLASEKKSEIMRRLHYLAESWGGKDNGFGLAECCQDLSLDSYPASATTLHFEFYSNKPVKTQPSQLCSIHVENIDHFANSPAEVMIRLLSEYPVPEDKQMLLFTHIRLAHAFSKTKERHNCILARLQAISVLVYSHALDNDVAHQIIYSGFINELVNVLELPDEDLVEMKAAVMRTLTAIIHLERNPKLEAIIDITGANTYHGFLPSLVRKCINHMVEPNTTAFPHSYSTALFSFLYHLASYESGGEALLSCGIMPSLLKLVAWHSDEQEHITFVTRAVRIIDLMTNMCTQSFESHGGLKVFIDRLEHEVSICRQEQPFIIRPTRTASNMESVNMDVSDTLHIDSHITSFSSSSHPSDVNNELAEGQPSSEQMASFISSKSFESDSQPETSLSGTSPLRAAHLLKPVLGVQCLPQRAALLKSILNFFKKVIPEPQLSFADSIRHVMEGPLPKALQHIISNAEYYCASLFLLALDVVTVFVFQEPSLLSTLQDKGLTEVVLHSLLVKDVPATREVLASLPNVFSALCLNQRGLDAFVEFKPFDKLFKVLLSPEYLPAMRKRKSSDTFADTANNLGTAMDELMRHQPSLKTEAIKAIIGLLREIIHLGTDQGYICRSKVPDPPISSNPTGPVSGPSSDIDSEDDEEMTNDAAPAAPAAETEQSIPDEAAASASEAKLNERKAIPLLDYILNVMKFVDAIMGNTTADDHGLEFINQGGLEPLFQILSLPNLPTDFATSQACQAVSSVCTILLKLCHEPKVIEEGLKQLRAVLASLTKLYEPLPPPGGSVLLTELVANLPEGGSVADAIWSPSATPLLHSLSAVHAYIKMFAHSCRFGQADLKTLSLVQWGSSLGLEVLAELGKLYFSLVWEGTILLALCSDSEQLPPENEFGRADLTKLLLKVGAPKDNDTESNSSNGVTTAMESLTTIDMSGAVSVVMEQDEGMDAGEGSGESASKKQVMSASSHVKQIRPLLNVCSRLGSTLAELFQSILVKLCVGSVMLRQRRSHHQPPPTPQVPSPSARAITKALCRIAYDGLNWKLPTEAHVPQLQMSFLMCSVGFTLPLLFEEKHAYHLMLQEFHNEHGIEAFLNVFYNVMSSLPQPDGFRGSLPSVGVLPDYSVDFLDSWLMLAEKLVHPKSIMDSMYALPSKASQPDFTPFDPIQHLKMVHKPIFTAILRLWQSQAVAATKLAAPNHSEQLEQVAISMLSILCHIVQGKKIVMESEKKESVGAALPPAPTSSSAPQDAALPAETARNSLRQLEDMGFPRDRCREALLFTSTVEQATEYLLNQMTAGLVAGGASTAAGLRRLAQPAAAAEMSEEDQMRAAIELSLSAGPETEVSKKSEASSSQEVAGPSSAGSSKLRKVCMSTDYLTNADLDSFADSLLVGCMTMLDLMPMTVFRVCQLIVAMANRNGPEWREGMFRQLLSEIIDVCGLLSVDARKSLWGSSQEEATSYFSKNDLNVKLGTRMHILTLLMQELEASCVSMLQKFCFVDAVLDLVTNCLPGLRLAGTSGTPQWLATVMLVIDQYEKSCTATRRRAEARKVLAGSSMWKWFDDRNGKWCAYNSSSNTVIDNAYKSGESSVRFTAGRRKYLVQFFAMIQLNEETGNRRPVMLAMPSKEEREKKVKETAVSGSDGDLFDGLEIEQMRSLLRCCVNLISIPVEQDVLHACLRLCLRCTRVPEMAQLFMDQGGVNQLLSLTQVSAFTGFTSICTLIIRHVLEDEQTLRHAFEKVVREAASGIGSNFCGVSTSAMGCREVNYVLRQLGPTACRNPQLLVFTAQKLLRINLPNGKEPPWTTQHQVDLVTVVPEKEPSAVPPPSETFRNVIASLLDILIKPYTPEPAKLEGDNSTDSTLATNVSKSSEEAKLNASAADSAKRPLLSKSAVLRMLSEFIKSYSCCASFVVQHSYAAGQADGLNETCSALSYIFDNLLPANQECGDKDCPALSKVLLASLASCNHSPEVQNNLVNELKAALQRTLGMAEVEHKYTHIQSLASLVGTLIDACPGSSQQKQSPLLMKAMGVASMNQLIKVMVKRGLVSDLARIAHSLDLSNPAMIATVNSVLAPLETLSRIVNQPQLAPTINNNNVRTEGAAPAAPAENEQGSGSNNNQEVHDPDPLQGQDQQLAELVDDDNEDLGNETAYEEQGQRFDSLSGHDVNMEELGHDDTLNVNVNITLPDDSANNSALFEAVQQRVDEVLGQALDEILSQGRSDPSENGDIGRAIDEELAAMSDDDEDDDALPGEEDGDEPRDMPYHEDEEDDTTDDEDDGEDDDDGDEGNGGGELGIDDDEWSDEEDIGGDGLANFLGFDDDDDDDMLTRLEAYEQVGYEGNAGHPRILVAEPGTADGYRTLHVPVNGQDLNDNNDDAVQPLPPAPNPVPIAHPLMNPTVNESSRQRTQPGVGFARAPRRAMASALSSRPIRVTDVSNRASPSVQMTLHNPQNSLLQRLFGVGMAANILQLTTRLGGGSARLYISDDDQFRLFSRLDEDPFSDFLQDGMDRMKNNSGPGILSNLPSTMYRWIEECRVLDGHSVHDVVTTVKADIIDVLMQDKKEQLEATAKKDKEAKENKEKDQGSNDVSGSQLSSATGVSSMAASLAEGRITAEAAAAANGLARSAHLLRSVDMLLGDPYDMEFGVAGVADFLSRRRELRNLLSVPTPQAHGQSPAVTNAVSSIGSSSSTFTATRDTVPLNSQPFGGSSVVTANQPALSSDAENATSSGNPEQDRACTPPNFYYDADEPVPLPLLSETPDYPVPASHLTIVSEEEVAVNSGEHVAEQTASDVQMAIGAIIQNPSASEAASLNNSDTRTSLLSEALQSPYSFTGRLDGASAGSQAAATSGVTLSTTTTAAVGTSTESTGDMFLGLEGVDPSFLEALPDSIRQEVIAEQLRLARIQRQARENAASLASAATAAATGTDTVASNTLNVSPEFLAALPPSIQEEVLAVQRAEQARQSATQAGGPDPSHDPGTFLNSLPSSLRQQVLADMDDSQIALLPADLMAEAQLLRGEFEDRNRRLQDQLFPGGTLGNILRQSAGLGGSRLTASRFLRRAGGGGFQGPWGSSAVTVQRKPGSVLRRGRQLLDPEALTCLLVLLFLDEPRLNTNRLHRIFKNLGYHTDTLLWIIRALISILIKANEITDQSPHEGPLAGKMLSQSIWLSFGMDAALGCRANVFHVQHSSKKSMISGSNATGVVSIHPQAAQLVCQHVLDTLIYLSKAFPNQFFPQAPESQNKVKEKGKEGSTTAKGKSPKAPTGQTFWDILIKLDQMRLTRKGKALQRISSGLGAVSHLDEKSSSTYEESPLGLLMNMLSSPVIRRSQTLTDKLLKLLSIVSSGVAEVKRLGRATAAASSQAVDEADSNSQSAILPEQLKLAVDVLKSKSCSEDGLEDSTKLLVRLSNANEATKQTIVKLLLIGAKEIGATVAEHINSLLQEARDYNHQMGGLPSEDSTVDLPSLDREAPSGSTAEEAGASAVNRGFIQDRFQHGAVVTIAPQKVKRTHELQLPSMAQLISKSSSQQFLLRLLKVIIQLSYSKSASQSGNAAGSGAASNAATGGRAASSSLTQPSALAAPAVSRPAQTPVLLAAALSAAYDEQMELMEQTALLAPRVPMNEQLCLDDLWSSLGCCLSELSHSSDQNAVLILQPAVEAFFLVHAGQKEVTSARQRRDRHRREDQLSHLNSVDEGPTSPAPSSEQVTSEQAIEPTSDTAKFLKFADTHRTVLNQILRQSQTPLSDGPFAVLVDHTRLLDFDVKLRYFRAELQRLDEGTRREDLAVHVRREHVFEDSYRELFRRTAEEWKHRLYIVFEGEEGQDAGGLLREWYVIMSREIFNPNYALFMTTPQDRVTYTINPLSHYNNEHLSYFKFVGRVIAKAIYDNKLLECYFTRSFYKHITGQAVKYTDMEAEDYSFYQGLEFLLTHDVKDIGYELTFSTEIQEFGVTQTRDLKPGGANVLVTEENKKEYVKLVCQLKMTGAIRKQLNAFLEGFYDIIPKYLISIFNEQELELLISGLPNVDIDDLKANTEYHKYNTNSLQIIWLWRALRSFDQAERARFLQFVTGTSKVPLQGFAFLEGMNGIQKLQIHRDDRSTDRLPCAHTCFNQLDLPAYETYDKLRKMLLLVINECSEGFGLA